MFVENGKFAVFSIYVWRTNFYVWKLTIGNDVSCTYKDWLSDCAFK